MELKWLSISHHEHQAINQPSGRDIELFFGLSAYFRLNVWHSCVDMVFQYSYGICNSVNELVDGGGADKSNRKKTAAARVFVR